MSAIKKVTPTEARTIIASIKTYFFDCDGVLWDSFGTVPGAVEFLNKLRSKNKKLFFITNNSTSSRKEYLKKFEKFGIKVQLQEILPTAYLAARHIKHVLKLKKVYLIGSQGIANEFDEEGIKYVGLGPQPPPNDPTMHYALNFDLNTDPEVQAVVVGYDQHFNLNKIAQALQYLKNEDMPFIATNTDSTFPIGKGLFGPGTGCIVKAVETAAGREATVLGKPNKMAYEIIKTMVDINPEDTLMIGDRLNTDILFGKNCGFNTLCVLSGVTNANHLQEMEKGGTCDYLPDYVADSVNSLLAGFEE